MAEKLNYRHLKCPDRRMNTVTVIDVETHLCRCPLHYRPQRMQPSVCTRQLHTALRSSCIEIKPIPGDEPHLQHSIVQRDRSAIRGEDNYDFHSTTIDERAHCIDGKDIDTKSNSSTPGVLSSSPLQKNASVSPRSTSLGRTLYT